MNLNDFIQYLVYQTKLQMNNSTVQVALNWRQDFRPKLRLTTLALNQRENSTWLRSYSYFYVAVSEVRIWVSMMFYVIFQLGLNEKNCWNLSLISSCFWRRKKLMFGVVFFRRKKLIFGRFFNWYLGLFKVAFSGVFGVV